MLLTGYNEVAERYNKKKLADLDREEWTYESEIQGKFDLARANLPAPAITPEGGSACNDAQERPIEALGQWISCHYYETRRHFY
jgi:hypothetical protein